MSGKISSGSSSSSTKSTTKTQKSTSTAPSKSTAKAQPQKGTTKGKAKHDQATVSEDATREKKAGPGSSDLIRGMGDTFGRKAADKPATDAAATDATDKPATDKPAEEKLNLDDSKTLRFGEGLRGKPSDSVKELQEALIKAGFGDALGSDGADGRFGKNTQDAVRQYQEKFMGKDQADGVVGKNTFGTLNNNNEFTPGAATDPSKPGAVTGPDDPQKHLLSLLAEGTNPNRITNLNPDFAKDLSRMMADLQENHNFSPRLTSGWRPGQGTSNHKKGAAADLTAAGKVPITDAQLATFREVAAKYGLKILDERHHGYNNDWSGAHLHISRTGR
jgi:peptidoglycan hydrolase-like protein with peptidoglycan-binding domain